jgi:mycoredoxin
MNNNQVKSNTIVMYTTSWCSDCHRAKFILDEYGIDYVDIDVDENPAALTFVKEVNNGNRVVPTIIFPDDSILVEPSNSVLAEKVGIELQRP